MSTPIKDISGQRFNYLQVLWPAGRVRVYDRDRIVWACQCDCGNVITTRVQSLRDGFKQSCGCKYWHGMYGTPEHMAYRNAKSRCQNPRNTRYADWGGRGIKFRFPDFAKFFAELGLKPSAEHSLDRINNNGHYEVGNVRWATRQEQRANTRPARRTARRDLCTGRFQRKDQR